jgi:bacterioferritin-associated ferredoxin
MNCCAEDDMCETTYSETDQVIDLSEAMHRKSRCGACNGPGRPVFRKTVLQMLKPKLIEPVIASSYRYCSTKDCSVVYFEDDSSQHLTVDDLRIRVGLKVKSDPIPLCYCFGFDEAHIREELARTGGTRIPELISKLIREGLCACDTRNPAGVCCLGEVNKTTKRLKQELPDIQSMKG